MKVSETKKDLVELSRRRTAMTHKIERLEKEADTLNDRFIEQKKKLESLNEALRKAEIRKDGFDKGMSFYLKKIWNRKFTIRPIMQSLSEGHNSILPTKNSGLFNRFPP